LLFHVGRGRLTLRLKPLKAAAVFNLSDLTLPDLIVGEPVDKEGAVVVVNGTPEPSTSLAVQATLSGATPERSPVSALLPLGTRKTGFRLRGPAPKVAENCGVELKLLRNQSGHWEELDTAKIALRVVGPEQTHKRTFRSSIDGSVQYYAVVPAKNQE